MNGGVLMFCIIAGLWLIYTPTVKTGVLPTLGIACVVVSSLAEIDAGLCSPRIATLRNAGVGLVMAGAMWRFGIRPAWLRLAQTWRSAHTSAKALGIERRHWGNR